MIRSVASKCLTALLRPSSLAKSVHHNKKATSSVNPQRTFTIARNASQYRSTQQSNKNPIPNQFALRRLHTDAGSTTTTTKGNNTGIILGLIGGGIVAIAGTMFLWKDEKGNIPGPHHLTEEQMIHQSAREVSLQERIVNNYEHRIRQMSAPEKVFNYFASVSVDGHKYMTIADFVNAIVPHEFNPSQPLEERAKRIPDGITSTLRLFDIDGDGLISFPEYVFFLTLLSVPENKVRIAFQMFDLDGSGAIDKEEFKHVMEVMRTQSPQTSHKRLRSATTPSGGIIRHFFGEDGNKKLSLEEFQNFLENLHRGILYIEFNHFDVHGTGELSPRDFALSLIAHTNLSHMSDYVKRAEALRNREGKITFEKFQQFRELLRNLDDIQEAMIMYRTGVNGAFTKEDFVRAAKVIANIDVDPLQADILFFVFDRDGNGKLEPHEFYHVLKDLRLHGLAKKRDSGIMHNMQCFYDCMTGRK